MWLKLTMRIEYTPPKAAWLMTLDNSQMAAALRSDCDPFKLPHPPAVNIRPPTKEGIEFFWSTYDGSKLFTDIIRAFDVEHLAARRSFKLKESAYVQTLKSGRSIVHMTLEESFEPGRPPSSRAHPRLCSPLPSPRALEGDTKPKAEQKSKRQRVRSPRPSLPAVNNRHIPRRPLARHNGSPRSYFKSEKERSPSPGYSYPSRSRSRSRSPKYRRNDSRSPSPHYRRASSRSRSPPYRRRNASRSSSPGRKRRSWRSRSPSYGSDNDSHRRGRRAPYNGNRSRSPPRERSPEYYGPEPPPASSHHPTPPPTSSMKTTVESGNSSIVARLTREYHATRRDIAAAAARGRAVAGQLAVLSATSVPMLGLGTQLDDAVKQLALRVADEYLRLRAAEEILGDVLRECERPVVVPGLLALVAVGWGVGER
ncbi:hypothetical protein C8R46DRAFT_1077332 [Mycena filopes]|nr:hypothetical protein C8R46DRAFT_1077332 [Mycena filopes]